jgi:hypothetical protein
VLYHHRAVTTPLSWRNAADGDERISDERISDAIRPTTSRFVAPV